VNRAKRVTGSDEAFVRIDCPGCDASHVLPTAGPRAWGFNGSLERPTFTPSILCRYHAWNDATEAHDVLESVCHSFVRDGRIEFLSDCTHPLAGQTVDLPEVKD
jgi:hypothetical protein